MKKLLAPPPRLSILPANQHFRPRSSDNPNHIKFMKKTKYLIGATSLAALLTGTVANAAIVTATQYSASHIVFDNTNTLIGGVTFFTAGTYDGIAFTQWTGNVTTATALSAGVTAVGSASFGTNRTNLPGGNQQYTTVTYTSGNAPGSVTISGLDSGQEYLIQYGFEDGRVGSFPYSVTATLTLSDASTGTTPLAIGAVTTADDFALITATVSGTTSLKLDLPTAAGNGVGPIINAFSVHQTVPEPSAALLGGMGLLGLLARRRRA